MSFGDRVVRQIVSRDDPRMPMQEPSELERAFINYKAMEAERDRLREENNTLRISTGALHAEVNMLREALERSDNDRIRLQGVSSSLAGGLRAINAVIGDQLRAAIKNGIMAVEAAHPEETAQLNEDAAEVRDIIERVEPTGTPLPDVRP